jgi:DNA-binding NtrC family response regulator
MSNHVEHGLDEHPDRTRPPAQVRVLVVEDEPTLREQLIRTATAWGFRATAASNGESGIKLNGAERFDIAILDLGLPGMNGIDTLARLRQTSPNLQGIILTGSATVDAARRAIHLGIVEFLTKPADLGELERALDRARRRVPVVLPSRARGVAPDEPASPRPTLEQIERHHIMGVLSHNHGDRAVTARQLGVSRKTLYNKLKSYLRGDVEP